jgi:phenylacetate-CoA ligase
VPSEFLKRVFSDYGFQATIVPNICRLDRFRPKSAKSIQPNFVVARHLEPVYNVGCILHAFALIKPDYPDATLTVLGGGTEELSLKRLAADLRIGDSVSFLGYINNERIPEIFAASSIFLNASVADNQPVSILEAFAAGLPVVTSAAGGITDMVNDDETGFVFEPNTPEALAARIECVLGDPDLTRRVAAHARSAARQYSWPNVFNLLLSVYGIARASR